MEGIQNESWWQHALDDVSSVLGEVTKWAAVVLVVIAIVVLIAAFPEITGPLLMFFADAGEALLAGLATAGEAFGGMALETAGEAVVEEGATELAGAETASLSESAAATGLEGTRGRRLQRERDGRGRGELFGDRQDLLDGCPAGRAVEDPGREQLVEGSRLGHEGHGRAQDGSRRRPLLPVR